MVKPNKMVKGGTKRAIPIEKIQEKNSRMVSFSKRRYGLYSKAVDLCLLSDSQIAILTTPVSSQSNVSFYSFGHSSVNDVVTTFLAGKRPAPVIALVHQDDVGISMRRKDLGLGFWWEDERLSRSEDPEELRAAIDSVSKLLKDLEELHSGREAVLDNRRDDQKTLDFCAISDDHNQADEYLKQSEETWTVAATLKKRWISINS